MNIKCIALDLDRTTLNASGRLSDGNVLFRSEIIMLYVIQLKMVFTL